MSPVRLRGLALCVAIAILSVPLVGCSEVEEAARGGATAVATAVSGAQTTEATAFYYPMGGDVTDAGYSPGTGDHVGRDYFAIDLSSDDPRVYPARAGVVAFSGFNCDKAVEGQGSCYGNTIAIDHGDGLYSIYTHLDAKPGLHEGDTVDRSVLLGRMSNSGCPGCSPHLHFVVRRGNPGIRGRVALFGGTEEPVDVRGQLRQR